MKEQINKICNNHIVILLTALVSAFIGGVLGVFAYYGQWLG
ncbi:hypothetical protein [uncultured Clostridium sp.]|nr:hypothetical protein [uncultured Clostridium sp.]